MKGTSAIVASAAAFVLGLVAIPSAASADRTPKCGSGGDPSKDPWVCNNVRIERVYLSGPRVRVATNGHEPDLRCTPDSEGRYIVVDTSRALFKEYYATLLAAYVTQKRVQIQVDHVTDKEPCVLSAVALLED